MYVVTVVLCIFYVPSQFLKDFYYVQPNFQLQERGLRIWRGLVHVFIYVNFGNRGNAINSPNYIKIIVRVVKSRRMRWAGYVARME